MKKHKKNKAFTLIELIATIVVLGIILAIAVPAITGIIKSSAKAAFESDAKLVLKAIDYKKLSAAEFDPSVITKDNFAEELGLSDVNYESVNFAVEDNVLIVSIIGKDKWDGLIACGTFRNMKVVENASQCEGDFIPPVLTVLGDNPVNIYIGETYTDAGAIALDNLAGNITDKIIITGTVNPNVPGEYTITYTIKDLFDNETTATRTINVIDNAFPIIDFNPNGNSTYAKSRTTTIDVRDLGIIDNDSLKYVWTLLDTEPQENEFNTTFINGGTVSTPASVSGSYYLWARASDTVGNVTITSSNVFNLDNEKPVIKINGNSSLTINKGSTYSDEGATATDNIDTTVTVTTTGSVNPNIVGTYTITYNAIDSSGNAATPVTRTVNVIDVKAPVITILGSNPATVSGGGTYSDAGATALDDVDGDVTSKITTTSTVNTNKLGTYTVTYKVTDKAGNTATSSRTVNVVDNILPTVTGVSVPTNWTSGNKTITVTGSDTGLSGIAGYYISTSSTKPTTASAWTASTSTIWTVSRGAGTYYIWVKDGAGNISSTYKSVNVTNIDANAPTVTAKGSSYTIIEADSNAISSTYFNISANGTAPISSTTCVDTSNGNATVTNTSTLAVGSHVIRCTVTKATGLSANAQTTIVVNPAYTCSTGTLTHDASKGWICVRSANSSTSWSVRCPNGSTCGTTGSACCRTSKVCTSWIFYDRVSFCGTPTTTLTHKYTNCEPMPPTGNCRPCDGYYCGNTGCPSGYSSGGSDCYSFGTEISGTRSTSYHCPSGWSSYTGSGSSLKCYQSASQ